MLVRISGKLTPIDPPILAVGTGVIVMDNDIEMDKAESAPVRHVTISVCFRLLLRDKELIS